ncbi:MAG: response regulator transcription factor [Chloroflexi bacterium]|nr:response regulator transcription factor [Chloroflexota bacterium]
MTIRILLVDDHSVVRQGLRMFLSLDPDLEVVGEASNGAEGIEQVRQLKPDVVLMDLVMPVMDGIMAIQQLRKESPDVEVIALTSVLEDEKVVGAVRAGAIGYLLKDTQADELCRAIKAAAQGQVPALAASRGATRARDQGARQPRKIDRARDGCLCACSQWGVPTKRSPTNLSSGKRPSRRT